MPHTLLAMLTRSEVNEKLSRSEALTILTVMLTRLKSDDFPNHNVIPPGAVVPEPSGHISYRDNRGRFPGSEKFADLWRAVRTPFGPPNTALQDVADTSSEGTLTSGKRRAG
ncbi:hypothetical protein AtubIFM57258_001870 [Aspergillus tubingensis]|nr:hypothetical protein AtubIFM57258_001870 [Aspergillus tubingensis]